MGFREQIAKPETELSNIMFLKCLWSQSIHVLVNAT